MSRPTYSPGEKALSPEHLADGEKFARYAKSSIEELRAVNPFSARTNYKIRELNSDVGRATFEFMLDRSFTNFMKVMHGGAISTMLDETASFAGMCKVGWFFRGTQSLTVDFLHPLRSHEATCVAEVADYTKKFIYVNAQLEDVDGQSVAHGRAILAYSR